MANTVFEAQFDGAQVPIPQAVLDRYPDCLLTILARNPGKNLNPDGSIRLDCDGLTLLTVAEFLETGAWPFSPYIHGNQLVIGSMGAEDGNLVYQEQSFEDICDLLGLPSFPIADDDAQLEFARKCMRLRFPTFALVEEEWVEEDQASHDEYDEVYRFRGGLDDDGDFFDDGQGGVDWEMDLEEHRLCHVNKD